jgi:hypothetical protein
MWVGCSRFSIITAAFPIFPTQRHLCYKKHFVQSIGNPFVQAFKQSPLMFHRQKMDNLCSASNIFCTRANSQSQNKEISLSKLGHCKPSHSAQVSLGDFQIRTIPAHAQFSHLTAQFWLQFPLQSSVKLHPPSDRTSLSTHQAPTKRQLCVCYRYVILCLIPALSVIPGPCIQGPPEAACKAYAIQDELRTGP